MSIHKDCYSTIGIVWAVGLILAGLLLDGWQGAVIQIVNLVMATAVYLPFVRAQDRHMLAEEKADSNSEEVSTTSDVPLHCGGKL